MISPRHCSPTGYALSSLDLPPCTTDVTPGTVSQAPETIPRSSPSPGEQRQRPRLDTKRSTSSEITNLFKSSSYESDHEDRGRDYLGAMQCAGCFPYEVDPMCFVHSPESIEPTENISGPLRVESRRDDSAISVQSPDLDKIRAKLKTPMRAPSFTFSSPVSPEVNESDLESASPLGAVRVQPGIIVCGNERWLVHSLCQRPQISPVAADSTSANLDAKALRPMPSKSSCPAPNACAQINSRRQSKSMPITCLDNTTVAVEPASQCKSSTMTTSPTAISTITTLKTSCTQPHPTKFNSPMPPDYFPDAGDTWIAGFYKHMRLWSRAQFDVEGAATETVIEEARRRALRASRRMMLYLDRAVEVSVTERKEELGLCCDECAVKAASTPSDSPGGKRISKEISECHDGCCGSAE